MGLGALLFTAVGARSAAVQMAATTTARELTGKVAIVTGARHNLGRAFAIVLAHNGANIVVHYHRAETWAEAEETFLPGICETACSKLPLGLALTSLLMCLAVISCAMR